MWIIIFILGIAVGQITHLYKLLKKEQIYLRRGILNRSYVVAGQSNSEFDVQFEVAEIERTETKSKIRAIKCVVSQSKHSSSIENIKKLIDDSWVISNEIEWIIPHSSDVRDQKLKQILN